MTARPARVGALALLIVRAGDHCSFKMSKQMLPWPLMLGWYTCRVRRDVRQGDAARVGLGNQGVLSVEGKNKLPGGAGRSVSPRRHTRLTASVVGSALTFVWKFTFGGLKG